MTSEGERGRECFKRGDREYARFWPQNTRPGIPDYMIHILIPSLGSTRFCPLCTRFCPPFFVPGFLQTGRLLFLAKAPPPRTFSTPLSSKKHLCMLNFVQETLRRHTRFFSNLPPIYSSEYQVQLQHQHRAYVYYNNIVRGSSSGEQRHVTVQSNEKITTLSY